MGLAYVRFAVEHPSHYRVMFGGDAAKREPSRTRAATTASTPSRCWSTRSSPEQRAGHVRRDDPQALALYIWAMVHGVAMLALDGLLPPPTTPDALARLAIARLHGGIDG